MINRLFFVKLMFVGMRSRFFEKKLGKKLPIG